VLISNFSTGLSELSFLQEQKIQKEVQKVVAEELSENHLLGDKKFPSLLTPPGGNRIQGIFQGKAALPRDYHSIP